MTTQAVLFLNDLDPDVVGDAGAHATHYEPVPVAEFRALLRALPPAIVMDSTFVDIGAGMGRAVLIASEHPFQAVLGIELSPALYEIARENLRCARELRTTCRDVRVVHCDARTYDYPPGNLVIFLYNPFDAYVLAATLSRIAARRTGDTTYILYHTPVERALFDAHPDARLFAEFSFGVIYAINESRSEPDSVLD